MAIGGYRFQPGADQPMGGPGGQGGRSVAPPSSSVKVLSYRMPKHDVRGAIAPAALLNGQGGGGAVPGGMSPHLLSLLLQAFSAQGSSDGPFTGSSDPAGVVGPSALPNLTPRFTIGDGGDRFREDYGPPMASGGGGGEIPPMGGFQMPQPPQAADRSHISPGPRYRMLDDSIGQPFGQPFDQQGVGHQFF